MKKNSDKKPKESKGAKKVDSPRKQAKTMAQRGLDEFLERKRIEEERIDEERKQAKKLTKGQMVDDAPSPVKKKPVEAPIVLERDLKTRNLVDKFYGGEEELSDSGRVEATSKETIVTPKEIVEETIVDEPHEPVVEEAPEEIVEETIVDEPHEPVAEEIPEEVLVEEEPVEELAVVARDTDEPSREVRQALLDTMKKRGAQEEKKVTPKDEEKAEKVKMVLGAAENLYKGTRKATRGTLNFAGGVAKGSVDVATAITGGVFGLVGQGVLGVVRVAGMGYRGVGSVTSGISKGVSSLAERGEGEDKKGFVGAVASGIAKKTTDFFCIEDGNKGPN